eukprot:2840168-Amphidinium_carterae.1
MVFLSKPGSLVFKPGQPANVSAATANLLKEQILRNRIKGRDLGEIQGGAGYRYPQDQKSVYRTVA